jgi:acetyltransferase
VKDRDDVELRDGRRVRLRPVRPNDAPAFMSFFEGLSAQSRDFMHGWSKGCTPEHAAKLAARSEASDHIAVAALPDEGERFVGYCWIDGMGTPEVPMLGIGIVDEFHEAGLGRILLRTMLDRAGRRGAREVRLGVWTDNARAEHVYRSVGFRDDPEKPSRDFDGRIELYMIAQTEGG